jgi:hypothetical protein
MLSGILFQLFYGLLGSWTAYLISILYVEYRTRKEREKVNFRSHVIQVITHLSYTLTFVDQFLLTILVCVWYHGRYVRITVIHRDFPKATKCSFCKIMVGHRDFNTFTVIPNTDSQYKTASCARDTDTLD